MGRKQELLDELMLMADLFGNGVSVETDIGSLSTRCGFTVGKTRRALAALQRKSKIRVSELGTKTFVGGYERVSVELLV